MATKSTALSVEEQAMDCVWHPAKKLLAVGLINGGIRVFDCSGAELDLCASWNKHTDSCRSLAYTEQANTLLSGSADKSLRGFDVETGKAGFRMKNAHECAIERVLSLPGSCLASGDENGLIKTWDWRAKSSISEFQAHSDFISDLKFHEAEQCLVAVSGDGSLSLNDLKTHKVRAKSVEADELSAVVIIKNGKKIVCGTQTGVLDIFSWGDITDCSDRMPGHPFSIDAIHKLDEDSVITGSGDGIVRVLSVQPHSLLGVLAQQEEGGCERIGLSHDHRLLATTSYDSVQLWDTSCLDQDDEEGSAEEELEAQSSDEEVQVESKAQKRAKTGEEPRGKRTKLADGSFFQDLL